MKILLFIKSILVKISFYSLLGVIISISIAHTQSFNIKTKFITLKKDSTLTSLLRDEGISLTESYKVSHALHDIFDPRTLKSGQKFFLHYMIKSSNKIFKILEFKPKIGTSISIHHTDNGFKASITKSKLISNYHLVSGTITHSLFLDAKRQNIPVPVIMKMIALYSYNVNFESDLHIGDTFDIMYQEFDHEDQSHFIEIKYTNLNINNKNMPLYLYTDRDHNQQQKKTYYNNKGESYYYALMHRPIDGAILSSVYGKRKHPILGYIKMHKGIDFAAPIGEPIFAAGNGKITKIGPYSSYGNYIRIEHNKYYSTAYAHMHKFFKGLHKGSIVKKGDIIGYVGATGRVTGPHLHYEIIKNSHQVNPMDVNLLRKTILAKKKRNEFFIHAKNLKQIYNTILITNN